MIIEYIIIPLKGTLNLLDSPGGNMVILTGSSIPEIKNSSLLF